MKLDAYTVVFLRRPPDAPEMSDEELDALQQGHLAFPARMREAGHELITGPLSGQPDQSARERGQDGPDASLRGIAIYRTSVEETRRLAVQDPSVQAGRLEVEADVECDVRLRHGASWPGWTRTPSVSGHSLPPASPPLRRCPNSQHRRLDAY